MAQQHTLSGIEVLPPAQERNQSFANLPRGFYLKAFSGSASVTFTDADDYAPYMVGELLVDGEPNTDEEYAVNGDPIVNNDDPTFAAVTVNVRLFRADPKMVVLLNHRRDRRNAAKRGEQLAFLNVIGDGSYDFGRVRVDKLTPTFSEKQIQTGYDTTFGFVRVDSSTPEQSADAVTPTASAVTPATGAGGISLSHTGTRLNTVTAVRFMSGATQAAQVTTFTTQSATALAYAAPTTALTQGTAYNVVLVYPGGTVSAGTFTRTS